jgi:hypothetical protein
MSVSTLATSLAKQLDVATPNNLTTYLQQLGFGRILRQQVPATRRGVAPLAPAAYPYTLQTGYTLALPDDAKAAVVLQATILAGTNTGECSPLVRYGTTPTTLQVAVSPSGDVVFAAADVPTIVDVLYMPMKQDAFEIPAITPVTAVVTIPTGLNGLSAAAGNPFATRATLAVTLMEAEILTGTVTGKCAVLVPGAAPGTTLQVNLNVAKTQVLFKVADAPTSVRLKFGLVSTIDQDALLEALASVI